MSTAWGSIFNVQRFSLHDGPGIRTTVFFKGCPLRCKWCANPESQRLLPVMLGGEADSRRYAVQEVVALCAQDMDFYAESGGGVTLSGGEPLLQMPFARALLRALRARSIHTAVETTGYVSPERFMAATEGADLLLFDVKHYDGARHRAGTGVDNAIILQNLRAAVRGGRDILPRIPVIPGFNDGVSDAKGFAALLGGQGINRAQLLPFHQMGEGKYALLGLPYAMRGVKPLHPEDLAAYICAMEADGVHAYC